LKIPIVGKVIKYAVILLLIAGLAGGVYYGYNKMVVTANAQNTAKEMTAKVQRGDIEVTISGTGTVQPISVYNIVPLVSGEILEAPFEEGMKVKAGDLLYKIDDSDLSFNIEKNRNNIERLRLSGKTTEDDIKSLEIYAPCEGRVTNFTVKEGEQIGSSSEIATIVDDKHLTALVPFNKSQVGNIKVGQEAQLILTEYIVYVDGKVTYVSSTPKVTKEGAMLYDVEITVDNPGAIAEGTVVTGIIKRREGDIISPTNGTISSLKQTAVTAKTGGRVKEVFVKEGQWVEEGQIILKLENDSLDSTVQKNSLDLEDAQLSLEAQLKKLKDYNILSPIDGTVIKKYYKAGDTIGISSDSKILMTVADLSKMIFTMDVDELDIAKISKGQKVEVIADALPDQTFEGEVTNVAMEGKTENGVTIYPVEVTISEPGQLKPGMNVNAKIFVESKKDVLYVPIGAVVKTGNKAFVYVMEDDKGPSQGGTRNRQGRQNEGKPSDNAQNGFQRSDRNNGSGSRHSGGAVAGRQRREVVVGINNDEFIEIVGGLREGEIVLIPSTSAGGNSWNRNMPAGGIGFPGMGGPPGGGGNMRIRR